MDKIELKTAFYWTCEECGQDNFIIPIKKEFVNNEEKEAYYKQHYEVEELPPSWEFSEMCLAPEFVTCKCGAEFETMDEYYD